MGKGRRVPKKNPYTWAGLCLLVVGIFLSLTSYLVFAITWLTALGAAMLVLAFILLALARTIPDIPPEVSSLLFETGIDNMATFMEELGIKSKATYLPSSMTGGRPQALIPLHAHPSPPAIAGPLPQRLIVRYGARPDDVGLLVTTFGATAINIMDSRTSHSISEIESALTSLFVGMLGVADRITVTHRENHISVDIYNPVIKNKATWSNRCLGGPLASVVASVAAEAWDKPVTISQEKHQKARCSIELEVLQ